MSVLKKFEELCKKYVDDHPKALRDAKRRCFAQVLKKKKSKSDKGTDDKLLAIQIEMRLDGDTERADALQSYLGRISPQNTATLEMLLMLQGKKRNDDRILASSGNETLRKFFRDPSSPVTPESPQRHSYLSSFFSPSSENEKRTNLFGALNASKLVPRSKPVRSLNLKLSIPVLVSVRDANVVKRAKRKAVRHQSYKKKVKGRKSETKNSENTSETRDSKENIWKIAMSGKHEKKRYRRERDQRPEKSLGGWVLFVRGLHEEAIEEDVFDKFVEHGEVKSIQMNKDRRTGFIKGYALVQYETFEDAKTAIENLNDTKIYGKRISVDWAFRKDPGRYK